MKYEFELKLKLNDDNDKKTVICGQGSTRSRLTCLKGIRRDINDYLTTKINQLKEKEILESK